MSMPVVMVCRELVGRGDRRGLAMLAGRVEPMGLRVGRTLDCVWAGVRCGALLKMRFPAIEREPMIKMRMIQTIKATKTGTTEVSVLASMTAVLATAWLAMAIEMPHQVRTAFIMAASIQAPKRYQTSLGDS